jgi:hypothetical protein
MLDAHPNTIAPPESRFLIHYFQRYHKVKNWQNSDKNRFISDISAEPKITYFWKWNKQYFADLVQSLPSTTSYGDMCKAVYASYKSPFPKDEPLAIIDKNPIYHGMIPLILKVYPQARFIHVVRDYRGTAASILQMDESIPTSRIGREWLATHQEINHQLESTGNKVHLVRYEDLISNTQNELEKLCTFLNVAFQSSMLSYQAGAKFYLDELVAMDGNDEIKRMRKKVREVIHKNIDRPIDATKVNDWSKRLSDEQILILEKICGKEGLKYGFQPETEFANFKSLKPYPFKIRKLRLYYSLPIWLRELKSKPDIAFVE